jgi:hypothetical protein
MIHFVGLRHPIKHFVSFNFYSKWKLFPKIDFEIGSYKLEKIIQMQRSP